MGTGLVSRVLDKEFVDFVEDAFDDMRSCCFDGVGPAHNEDDFLFLDGDVKWLWYLFFR